jgi:hypothetical protein
MPNRPPAHLDNWFARGNCNGKADMMLPHSELCGRPLQRAKRTCLGCPVQDACLDDALSRNEKHGIWGGLSTPERKAYRGGAAIGTCGRCKVLYANAYGSGMCHPCTPVSRRRLAERSPELAAVAR